jgi:hypothetical protein
VSVPWCQKELFCGLVLDDDKQKMINPIANRMLKPSSANSKLATSTVINVVLVDLFDESFGRDMTIVLKHNAFVYRTNSEKKSLEMKVIPCTIEY